MTTDKIGRPAGRAAIRMVFAYDGNDITVTSRQRFETIAPPSEPLNVRVEGRSGFWAEVRDEEENPLYRQLMHDPMPRSVEVFSEDAERSIARVPIESPSGSFVVVIPVISGADHLVLIGTPFEEPSLLATPRVIARFSLTQKAEGWGEPR